nr:manganese efflux pump [Propionibacterium sp.]
MSFVEVVLIAVGLAMDAFAVSVGKGLAMRRLYLRQAAAIAVAFGAFQGGMPLLGWAVGTRFADLITSVDHWIAFGLLSVIGGRMLYEALWGDPDGPDTPQDAPLGVRELLVLAVATSIDALAAGVGFAFLDLDIVQVVTAIALITGTLSFVGVLVGHRFGARSERPAEALGGLILIGIGTKILLEHVGLLPW